MEKKVFTEEQVKEIIRKAAEMQKNQTSSQESESGLSMEELLEIGKESGLNVNFIKTAALEFEDQKITQHSDINDTHIFEERVFNSNLNEHEIWREVLSELSHHFGDDTFGKAKIDKNEKKWSHLSISGIQTIVSLSKKEKATKLKLSQRVGLGSPLTEGIMYGGGLTFLIMMIITSISALNTLLIVALSPNFFILSSILIYKLDIIWRQKKLKGLKTLANKIFDNLPKKSSSSKQLEKTNESLSEIEIESEDVYQNNDNLNNDLREKE